MCAHVNACLSLSFIFILFVLGLQSMCHLIFKCFFFFVQKNNIRFVRCKKKEKKKLSSKWVTGVNCEMNGACLHGCAGPCLAPFDYHIRINPQIKSKWPCHVVDAPQVDTFNWK